MEGELINFLAGLFTDAPCLRFATGLKAKACFVRFPFCPGLAITHASRDSSPFIQVPAFSKVE
jgi:hypothetical protein